MKMFLGKLITVSCLAMTFGIACNKSGSSSKTPAAKSPQADELVEATSPANSESTIEDCANGLTEGSLDCLKPSDTEAAVITTDAEAAALTESSESTETTNSVENIVEAEEIPTAIVGSPVPNYTAELANYNALIQDPAFANLPYPTNGADIKYGDDTLKTITLYHAYFTGIKVYYGHSAATSGNLDKSINVDIKNCEVFKSTLLFCDKSVEDALVDIPLAKRADVTVSVDKTTGNTAALKPYGEILIVETLTRADYFSTLSHIGFYFDAPNLVGIPKNKLKLKENGIITLADGTLGYIHQFAVVNRPSMKKDKQDDWYSEFKPHIVTRTSDGSNVVYWDRAHDNYRLWEGRASGVNIDIDLMDLAATEQLINVEQ